MSIIQELKKQIEALSKKIHQIQEQCSHPNDAVDKDPYCVESDSGHRYDQYYYKCYCKLCEKHWNEPQ